MENKNLNDWAISEELFDYVLNNLKPGSTILELGSGTGTIELCKHYKVYSIEHDIRYVGLAPSTYIHAPITNGWYNIDILKEQLPEHYDMIIVDGPTGKIGRYGFLSNIDLFDISKPIIFDDTNRPDELKLVTDASNHLNKPFETFTSKDKSFSIIK